MVIKKTIPVTGYCAFKERNGRIDATYQKIQVIGDMQDYKKLVSIQCEFSSECNIPESECEIIQTAKLSTIW